MQNLELESADVYGALVAINLADHWWRAALTDDFLSLHPVREPRQLRDLAWLDPTGSDEGQAQD